MSNTIQTIRQYKTENFLVTVKAVDDNGFYFDDYWDEDLVEEIQEKIDTGDLMVFGVVAKVYYLPTGTKLGEDSIWGCIYSSPDDFQDHKGSGKNGSYFADIVRAAIRQARSNVKEISNSLKG